MLTPRETRGRVESVMKKKTFKPTLTQSDIDWLIDSMKLVFATKEELASFKNSASGSLDVIVGMLKDKRETQELHAKNHSDIR